MITDSRNHVMRRGDLQPRSSNWRTTLIASVAIAAIVFALPRVSGAQVPVTSGLQVHLAADDVDNNPATSPSAGSFSPWENLSSGGASIGGFSPGASDALVVLNALNGKPVVRFNGNDFFNNNTAVGNSVGAELTIFAVSESNSASSNGVIVSTRGNSPGGAGENGFSFRYSGGSANTDYFIINGGSVSASFEDKFNIFEATLGTNLTMSVDGGTPASAVAGNITPTAGGTNVGTSLFGGLINPLDGDIAELLIYNSILSASELNQVGYYLESKYGLDTPYVPEPCTCVLVALGVLCLGCVRWRKRDR